MNLEPRFICIMRVRRLLETKKSQYRRTKFCVRVGFEHRLTNKRRLAVVPGGRE